MAVALAFADPVHDAQRTFRAVMNAMARPGTIHRVAGLVAAPAPLSPVAAAVAVALADYETPLWLDAPLAAMPDVPAYLTFHTGARIVAAPSQAAFALVADAGSLPDFAEFALGTDVYPDRSTTLVVQVESLVADMSPLPGGERSDAERPGEGNRAAEASMLPTLALPSATRGDGTMIPTGGDRSTPARHIILAGPGIKGHATLAVAGLPADIVARLAANRALFPRGVDLVLAGPEGVAALPRTTRVTVTEA